MIVLDHHIVPSRQRDDSARWLTHILGLPGPRREGPFAAVDLGGATSLFFAGWDQEVATQHYAFAVGLDEFDRIIDRLVAADVDYWADHTLSEANTVRRDNTGNGVYFRNPDGHLLEVLTHS
jgi:catechol 2,3-dioxygenase-like lactoylglutathione lyase family enzyme